MKKILAIVSAVIVAACAHAALDFSSAKMIPVFAPTSISSGATNTATFICTDMKGASELVVYATPHASRTALNVTIWGKVGQTFTTFAETSYTKTNGICRLAFPAEYMTTNIMVTVGTIGAASTASAMILTH